MLNGGKCRLSLPLSSFTQGGFSLLTKKRGLLTSPFSLFGVPRSNMKRQCFSFSSLTLFTSKSNNKKTGLSDFCLASFSCSFSHARPSQKFARTNLEALLQMHMPTYGVFSFSKFGFFWSTLPATKSRTNKNRLCSKTCSVDIDIEDKKDQAKLLIGEIINIQRKMNGSMEKRFFYKNPWIPPRS